jgi:amino acid transporter/nucleotide-binding universal stress UspA family protein
LRGPVQVIVVSSVMFTFISYWRVAAVVLCDLASTAFYICGIVENAIGPAAPWFILAVMLFSGGVCFIYIESCSLFVRGGVYRVVKEAMGGFLAKLSVSALMFDYILTGPISAASAGQYIMGLLLESLAIINPDLHGTITPESAENLRRMGSMVIACVITLYFFRQNLLGIHESSDKALKIVIAACVMAVVIFAWAGLTLAIRGPVNKLAVTTPDLSPKFEREVEKGTNRATGEEADVWKRDPQTGALAQKMEPDEQGRLAPVPKLNEATGRQEDPLGFIGYLFPGLADKLRAPGNWWNLIGVIGLFIAFGHSILAMSGEETLAQVYREVESPKLPNFKKAAVIVFFFSLTLTVGVAFLAALLIPDEIRMKNYADNIIGGLAMNVIGPPVARLLLNAFVVVVGFLILAGAVNTAIIGSNGVLNRVAEDGVMPDWFLKPHRRFGTTYRVLYLIVGMQLLVIIASRGNMYVLGEAYAFGVVWSFALKALAMVVLRFKDRSPREFKVPLNIRIRGVDVPIGLTLVFLILLATAVLNVLTKEVATIGGVSFTIVFLAVFILSEHYHEKRRGKAAHQHLEQFNQQTVDEIAPSVLNLNNRYRKLVAIRSTQNLFMLEKTLAETDPETTDVAVMTAHLTPRGDSSTMTPVTLDQYERELMTAVVQRAEKAGKQVRPLILPTNNPLHAVVTTAKNLDAQELVLGASNTYTADEQFEQIAFYWINANDGEMKPLTVRILSRTRDVYLDLGGGNRIPKISERQARSIAELRAAGVGVSHVLLVHDNTAESSDLFDAAMTMLDPQVILTVALIGPSTKGLRETNWIQQNLQRAQQLDREVNVEPISLEEPEQAIIKLAQEKNYDLIVLGPESSDSETPGLNVDFILQNAPCSVCRITPPPIPQDVEKE